MTGNSAPRRLNAVDALRGVAALAVVVHHWTQFAVGGPAGNANDMSRLPFALVLRPAYEYGFFAVDLFFVISGFVFFWLYGQAVASRAMPAARFAVLRLSRLYPLHLATLLLVAVGQAWWTAHGNTPFIYQWNDLRHFLLNLGFASSWGFERDMSFNGPAWSVSVEILLYVVFFAWVRWLPRRLIPCLLGAVAGRVLFLDYFPIGRGLSGFFIGGAIAVWHERRQHAVGASASLAPVWLAGIAWAVSLATLYLDPLAMVASWMRQLGPDAAATPLRVLGLFANNWSRVVLMPATVMAAVALDDRLGVRLRNLSALGELSYSAYMIHFPLQLAMMNILVRVAPGANVVYSPVAFLLFLAIVVATSLWTYRKFEYPAQQWIRGRLASPRLT